MASCLAMAIGLWVMPAMAQEQPEECFPQGTVWEEEKVDVFPVGRKMNGWNYYGLYLRSTVAGEMTVEGVTYKMVTPELKVTDDWNSVPGNFAGWNGEETGWHWEALTPYGIREQDGKVYYYGNLLAGDAPAMEVLRYDFNNWEVGKEIPFTPIWNSDHTFCYENVEISEIGKVEMNDGSTAECAYMSWGTSNVPIQVRYLGNIERVFMFENTIGSEYFPVHLRKFTRNGELVYEYTEPLGAELGIESAAKDGGFGEDIYTLQGVRLNGRDVSGLPKGIYIRGGKKYLVR